MPNENNLIPANMRSKAEARANSAKGGVESGKSRRRKKLLGEALKSMLEGECPDHLKKTIKDTLGHEVESLFDAMAIRQIEKAIKKSDTSAFETLLNRAEGKPKQKVEAQIGYFENNLTDEEKQILEKAGVGVKVDAE